MSQLSNLRSQFPALQQKVNNHPLVYLDSAATSLKPKAVIDRISRFYSYETANVHRGAHYLSDRTTVEYESVRQRVQRLLNAKSTEEIIFTSGTTASINLVARAYAEQNLKVGDEILLTEMEHHSNIVPWQMVAEKTGAIIQWTRVRADGELDMLDFKNKLSEKTKIVSLTHASNTLGTVNNIQSITSQAHAVGAVVVIDAAQSMTFEKIDVQNLNCDFLAFSAHKMYGPYGLGVLYGKKQHLDKMQPVNGGGAMIDRVTKAKTTYHVSPYKFEPGTPNISSVVGFGAALDFIEEIGQPQIKKHETELLDRTVQLLSQIPRMQMIGASPSRVNVVSFVIEGQHASDIGHLLDQQGIAVRTGHHCNQVLMDQFGLTGTVRVSFGVHNSLEDIEVFYKAIAKVEGMLR